MSCLLSRIERVPSLALLRSRRLSPPHPSTRGNSGTLFSRRRTPAVLVVGEASTPPSFSLSSPPPPSRPLLVAMSSRNSFGLDISGLGDSSDHGSEHSFGSLDLELPMDAPTPAAPPPPAAATAPKPVAAATPTATGQGDRHAPPERQ